MKILSFFSYKGGAGRSTLAYNTIPVLAKDFMEPTAKNPIIILDMDIDSRGMTILLDSPKGSLNITEENSVQHLLANRSMKVRTPTIKEHPVLGKFCPVGNVFGYEDNDAILLVPAIAGGKIDAQSSSNYENKNPLIPMMQSFIDCCELMNVTAVIFDSSVGNQLTANVSNEMANIIICCMKPTRQFREGTEDYFLQMKHHISAGKHIVLVPNVVPTSNMIIQNRSYPDEAVYQINRAFSPFAPQKDGNYYHLDMLDRNCFGVPALQRFMWCEDILRNQPLLTDEERVVLERYTKLAKIIDDIDPDED